MDWRLIKVMYSTCEVWNGPWERAWMQTKINKEGRATLKEQWAEEFGVCRSECTRVMSTRL